MKEINAFIELCNLCYEDRILDTILDGKTPSEIEHTIKSQAISAVSTTIVPYITAISACVVCYLLLSELKIF